MEENFRNALIIISAIVIGAIFVHGLWTIRKNKNPYKLKAKPEDINAAERSFDSSGFDQDGVSQVKVIKKNAEPSSMASSDNSKPIDTEQVLPSVNIAYEPDIGDLSLSATAEPDINLSILDEEPEGAESKEVFSELAPALNDDLGENKPEEIAEPIDVPEQKAKPVMQSVYADPVTHAKPMVEKKPARTTRTRPKSNEAAKHQMGFDFDEKTAKKQEPKVENEVLVLSVVAAENHMISGAALLPTLLTLGMKYGEMNIFHRHQDNAGNGDITFSLANMMQPGTFDLDNMESFATKGVSLFMTLPNTGNAFEVFEQMLSAAKQLAQEFQGQLLDDKRSVMTKQTEQHYISKIREFERKNCIAAV